MIARTVSFTSRGKLSLTNNQLVWDGADGRHATMPVEDIGFVLLESDQISVTSAALRFLTEHNVALVVCDKSHTPSAQLLAYAPHTTAAETIEVQLAATEAVRGRLWRKICRQKILNQAALMARLKADKVERLRELADAVKNGDPSNCEGQAARLYFHALAPDGFVRDRDGVWPNAALNYGYAILRAAVARAIVGSGMVCFNGVHHHNRYNAFALADDLMEPYRPFVDQYIFGKVRPFDVPVHELERVHKARLLEMLTCDVRLGEKLRPLMIALSYTTGSLVRYFKGETDDIQLPSFI